MLILFILRVYFFQKALIQYVVLIWWLSVAIDDKNLSCLNSWRDSGVALVGAVAGMSWVRLLARLVIPWRAWLLSALYLQTVRNGGVFEQMTKIPASKITAESGQKCVAVNVNFGWFLSGKLIHSCFFCLIRLWWKAPSKSPSGQPYWLLLLSAQTTGSTVPSVLSARKTLGVVCWQWVTSCPSAGSAWATGTCWLQSGH